MQEEIKIKITSLVKFENFFPSRNYINSELIINLRVKLIICILLEVVFFSNKVL